MHDHIQINKEITGGFISGAPVIGSLNNVEPSANPDLKVLLSYIVMQNLPDRTFEFLKQQIDKITSGTPDSNLKTYLEYFEKNKNDLGQMPSLEITTSLTGLHIDNNRKAILSNASEHSSNPEHNFKQVMDDLVKKLIKNLKTEYKNETKFNEKLSFIRLVDENDEAKDYLHFFKANKDSRYRYSIIGSIGSGKLSILEDLKYRWASENLLEDFTFVFFICVHNLITKSNHHEQNNYIFFNVIEKQCLKFPFGHDFNDEQKKFIMSYLYENKEKILWLVEGSDEIPENDEYVEKFIHTILKFPNVVLTTKDELSFQRVSPLRKLYTVTLDPDQITTYYKAQESKYSNINCRLIFYENNKDILNNTLKNLVSLKIVFDKILNQKNITITQLYIELFQRLLDRYHNRCKLVVTTKIVFNLENYYKQELLTLYDLAYRSINKEKSLLPIESQVKFVLGFLYIKSNGNSNFLDPSIKCFFAAKYIKEEFVKSQDKKAYLQSIIDVFTNSNKECKLTTRFLAGLMNDINEYHKLFFEILNEYIRIDFDFFLEKNGLYNLNCKIHELLINISIGEDLKIIAKGLLPPQDFLKLKILSEDKIVNDTLKKAIYDQDSNFKRKMDALFLKKNEEKFNFLICGILSLEEKFGEKIYSKKDIKFSAGEENVLEKFKNYALNKLISVSVVEKEEILEIINRSSAICKRISPTIETCAKLHEDLLKKLLKPNISRADHQKYNEHENVINAVVNIYKIDKSLFKEILAQKFKNENLKELVLNMCCVFQNREDANDILSDFSKSLYTSEISEKDYSFNDAPNQSNGIYSLIKILLSAVGVAGISIGIGISLLRVQIETIGFIVFTLLAAISTLIVELKKTEKDRNIEDRSEINNICERLLYDPIRLVLIYRGSEVVDDLSKIISDKWKAFPFLNKAFLGFLLEDNPKLFNNQIAAIRNIFKYKMQDNFEKLVIDSFVDLSEEHRVQIFRKLLKVYQEDDPDRYDSFLKRILLPKRTLNIQLVELCRIMSSLDSTISGDNKLTGLQKYAEDRITELMLESMLALYTPSLISILLITSSKLKVFFNFAMFCDLLCEKNCNQKIDNTIFDTIVQLYISPFLFDVEKFKKIRETGVVKNCYSEIMVNNTDTYLSIWKFVNFCSVLKWIYKDEELQKVYSKDILLIRNNLISKQYDVKYYLLAQTLLDEAYSIEAKNLFPKTTERLLKSFKNILKDQLFEKNHVKIWKAQEKSMPYNSHTFYNKTNEGKTPVEETQELRTILMYFNYNLDEINEKIKHAIPLLEELNLKTNDIISKNEVAEKTKSVKHDYIAFDSLFNYITMDFMKIKFSKYMVTHWDSYITNLLDYRKGTDRDFFSTYKIWINQLNCSILKKLQLIYNEPLNNNFEVFHNVLGIIHEKYELSKSLAIKILQKLNNEECILDKERFYSSISTYIINNINSNKEFSQNNFRNPSMMIDKLLDAIGKENDDGKKLGDFQIARSEVAYTVSDINNYYTVDFINILLYGFNQKEASIKVYPANAVEKLRNYLEGISTQKENYSFIPLSIAYDANTLKQKNHWAALIIDKKYQLVFYLDPAKKTPIPKQVKEIIISLNYKNEIVQNPIDFQQKEKQGDWIRHCGVYVVEIFKVFLEYIQKNQCISGNLLPNISIDKECDLYLMSKLPTVDTNANDLSYENNYIWLESEQKLYYIQQNKAEEVIINDIDLFKSVLKVDNKKSKQDSIKKPQWYAILQENVVTFEENMVIGDGWCTLNAIGIKDPQKALTDLQSQLDNPEIRHILSCAIEDNWYAHQSLSESFTLNGRNAQSNDMLTEIRSLWQTLQSFPPEATNTSTQKQARANFENYLSRKAVLKAYLQGLQRTKYVNSHIATACLKLQDKKLAVFRNDHINKANGQLSTDAKDVPDENTISLVFHPGQTQFVAHYNTLRVLNIRPVLSTSLSISEMQKDRKQHLTAQEIKEYITLNEGHILDKNSISLQTALSNIPCGEAEIVESIRKNHIKDACKLLKVDLKDSLGVKNVKSKSSENLRSYLEHIPNLYSFWKDKTSELQEHYFKDSLLKILLVQAKILLYKHENNQNFVHIAFTDYKLVQSFTKELHKIGISNLTVKHAARKPEIIIGEYGKEDEYIILLTANEYNIVLDDESAYAKLLRNINEIAPVIRINN